MNSLTIVGKLIDYIAERREIKISMEGMRKPHWEPDEYILEVAEQISEACERNFAQYGRCLVAVQGDLVKDEGAREGEKKLARFVTFLVDAAAKSSSAQTFVPKGTGAMAKTVLVEFKNGTSQKYHGVSTIEEDRNFEHVTAVRLYGTNGNLMARLSYGQIAQLSVSDVASD